MVLPEFIIIGAAKAGTTSLYAILGQHPQIFMSKVKEPEFFARDEIYANGIESYAESFAAAQPGQIIGEASTIYSLAPLFPKTAKRIKEHIPKVKLIYVLRQPAERSYSFYVQILKNYQNVTKDFSVHRCFEEFVLPERHAVAAPRSKAFSAVNDHLPDVTELCLAGSEYVYQIETYLKHFDQDQILFLKFEDFVRDRAGEVRKITDFLGVEALDDAVLAERAVTQNVSRTHFEKLGSQIALKELQDRSSWLWNARRIFTAGLAELDKTSGRVQAVRKHPCSAEND